MSVDPDAARDLLAFYLEAGVDAVLEEEPVDRFADTEAIPPPGRERPADEVRRVGVTAHQNPARSALRAEQPRLSGEGKGLALLPPDAAAAEAREAARQAQSLDQLRAMLDGFEGCGLKATATQLVFADGNPDARLMLVGEAPGRDEDLEGRPFVGRSGQLLDRMLAAIGLDRTSVYIANVVPWRPPGNRTPSPQETQVCLPFIRRQIELCDPEVLVCLGGPSAETLLGQKGITKIRGRWFDYDIGTRTIRAMPTFHPAFLLRSPLQKRFAWRDFLAIKKALDG
jgi:uracil-DNA glycosylase family 4